jgi:hypothetical protein
MNPNENTWGVWSITYKHVISTPAYNMMRETTWTDIFEEQLDCTEACVEISRIMQLK